MKTLVLQSQRPGVLPAWQRRCCDSVRAWSKARGFDYNFCGDELFRPLPPALREKLRVQPVVATDLARLLLMGESLRAGYERAIWCDADLLIFRDFEPLSADHSFGREVWVKGRDDGIHSYRRIHNAWLQFTVDSPILPFYIDRASAMLERVKMPVVPQFIGPKLLSALHNIVGFHVEERVGMLSPLSMRDLLRGTGPALTELTSTHTEPLCAVNLCASYVDKSSDGVCHSDEDYSAAIRALIAPNCPL
ncbi:hypothetical protein [Congregibacter sp.]|uniref:hypothetical protein n=1 Tax=Congregibacter sp. TaxID=2744308 RepID=UPI003F6D9FBA